MKKQREKKSNVEKGTKRQRDETKKRRDSNREIVKVKIIIKWEEEI